MATSDSYDHRFDEDVPSGSNAGCPDCGGRVRTNSIETICEDCGLVLHEEPIDHGPEWRSFEDDRTNPERTGAPLTPTRHDRGISTEIGRKTDGRGNNLSGSKRRQLGRFRREHSRARFRSKSERNLAHGLSEVSRIVSALDVSDVIDDQACDLFRSAQSEDLFHGRSIEAMAAGSVYAACRCNRLPWTLDEVSAVSRVNKERIENAYRALNRELGLPTVPPSPQQYVPRLASELGFSEDVRRVAVRLAKQAEERGIANGPNPAGVAAGCFYQAVQKTGADLTQQEIADVAGVSPATLRERWREIKEH